MAHIDVVPDVHGQHGKLAGALETLGWVRTGAGWRAPAPGAGLLFLGDFIDRGPNNADVLRTVRELIDGGHARAVMGNHEFNAIHFHTLDPATGRPLRTRCAKNAAQHAAFLAEFPIGAGRTAEWIDWMAGLPLFLEWDGLRAAHASWRAGTITALREAAPEGVLDRGQLIAAAHEGDPLHDLAEEVLKGPEHRLPEGFSFRDKGGHERRDVRLRWWASGAGGWRDVALSVPDPSDLPDAPVPAELAAQGHGAQEPPVVFGHYWLMGAPVLQAPNALCLDYSAGADGPLATYRWEAGDARFELGRITLHETDTFRRER